MGTHSISLWYGSCGVETYTKSVLCFRTPVRKLPKFSPQPVFRFLSQPVEIKHITHVTSKNCLIARKEIDRLCTTKPRGYGKIQI